MVKNNDAIMVWLSMRAKDRVCCLDVTHQQLVYGETNMWTKSHTHTHAQSFNTNTNLHKNLTLFIETPIQINKPFVFIPQSQWSWFVQGPDIDTWFEWFVMIHPPPIPKVFLIPMIRQYTTLQESRQDDSVEGEEARSDNTALCRE